LFDQNLNFSQDNWHPSFAFSLELLNFILSLSPYREGIIGFFTAFNETFRNELPTIALVQAVEAHTVDDPFNVQYGYHGPPGRGRAFLFSLLRSDGTREMRHFCLGASGDCEDGCRLQDFGF